MKVTYIKTALKSLITVPKIVTIHYFEFDKNFVFNGESHDLWEMVYVDKGCVQIQRDEESVFLKQGELILHKPNEFHSIRAYNSSPNFFVISFVCHSSAMQYLEKMCTVLEKPLQPFISSILQEAEKTYVLPKNTPTLKRLIKKENAPLGSEQLIKTYLEQLLILLVRKATKSGDATLFPTKESMQNHLVLAVKSYIAEHLEGTVRVSEICDALGYSKSYLSKLFEEQSGETIAAYATREKINLAKRLIREGSLNFAQISDKLGFDNPQYFSRVFKRVTHSTPTEFKLSLRFENE